MKILTMIFVLVGASMMQAGTTARTVCQDGRCPQVVTKRNTCCTDATCGTCAMELEVLDEINQARHRNGLPPFRRVAQIVTDCRNHSALQQARNRMFHASNLQGCSECVAAGQTSGPEVVQDWLNSPGHRAILLSRKATCGVGRAGNFWTFRAR